jgi:hypothetical protein
VSSGAILSFLGGLAGAQIAWREAAAVVVAAVAVGVKLMHDKR